MNKEITRNEYLKAIELIKKYRDQIKSDIELSNNITYSISPDDRIQDIRGKTKKFGSVYMPLFGIYDKKNNIKEWHFPYWRLTLKELSTGVTKSEFLNQRLAGPKKWDKYVDLMIEAGLGDVVKEQAKN